METELPENEFAKHLTDAIQAHGTWKLKLRTAINTGKTDQDPSHIACDDRCALGQWLKSPVMTSQIRAGMPHQVVSRLHRKFHANAGEVAKLAIANRKSEADALLEGKFQEGSQKLVRALRKWRGEVETRH